MDTYFKTSLYNNIIIILYVYELVYRSLSMV